MLKFQESVYQGRWVQRAVLHAIRTISRISKSEQTAEKIKEEFESYKQTDDYKKWQKDYDNREDDDDVKNDVDP